MWHLSYQSHGDQVDILAEEGCHVVVERLLSVVATEVAMEAVVEGVSEDEAEEVEEEAGVDGEANEDAGETTPLRL